jgi:hypothetical protein
VKLVVAVPTAQGGGAGVGKKILQRRRFNVAVAKCHIGSGENSKQTTVLSDSISEGMSFNLMGAIYCVPENALP